MKRLILPIFILLSSISFAQDTTKQILELSPIVIMGIRADKKVPISQQIVYKSDIQKVYQGQEIPILLDKTTSITSQSDAGNQQGYTYFRIRGIDQSRINMTLNGVPLNEPEDQGVYTSNYPGFINAIESMQIQRGVGTSTNGVASYGGSINFNSQTGEKKGGNFSFGGGSFTTGNVDLSYGSGLHKNFAYYGNFFMGLTDGYKYNSGCNGFSGLVSAGYYGKKDVVKITAFSGTSANQMAWLAVSESDIKKDPRTNYNKNDANDLFAQNFIQLQYIKSLNINSKFTTALFYNNLNGSYDYFSSGDRSVFLKSNFYGLISGYQYEKNNIKINTGVNVNFYDRRHTNIENHKNDLGIGLYTNIGYKNDLGTFVKASYDIHKFTAFADLQQRYTEFKYKGDVPMNKLSWNFWMPKVGLTYNHSSRVNFYGFVGTSKREPTRTNLFGGQDNLTTLVNIKPEQVVDYELGTNINYSKLNVQSNVYHMHFNNEITLLGALGSNSLPLMTNVTNSFRSGLELNVAYNKITDYLSTNTNLNWSYNCIKDNGIKFQPLYTPSFVWNQILTIHLHRLNINLNSKYQSKSYISFDNQYTSPSFMVFGVNIDYTINKFMLLLQGNNLTGKQYFTNGYVIDSQRYFFVSPRRTLYVTVKIAI
jgi:iron complex outermembrane receptor protein